MEKSDRDMEMFPQLEIEQKVKKLEMYNNKSQDVLSV